MASPRGGNEPEPFWTGHDAVERVREVSQDVPSEAGRFEPAGAEHNGSSGRVLDEMYLRVVGPRGTDRDACWITDLHQAYLANEGQLARIRSSYDGWVARRSCAAGECPRPERAIQDASR